MAATIPTPTERVQSIDVNGLSGRMVHIAGRKPESPEILFVYGQHATLERWMPLLHYLNRFGAVTAVDLPGLGGMTSLYAIGERPTINTYADYLAAFFKLKFRRKRVTIVAEGFGFAVVTRLLQRYPALRHQVRFVMSMGGTVRFDDIVASRGQRRYRRALYAIGSWQPVAVMLRIAARNQRLLEHAVGQDRHVMTPSSRVTRTEALDALMKLVRQSDIRTQLAIARQMLTFDNCQTRIDVPLIHVRLIGDQTIDHAKAESHLHVLSSDVTVYPIALDPPLLYCLDDRNVAALIPPRLRRQLKKQ